MIDLTVIEKDINALQTAINRKKDEYANAKKSNLKEQYGDDFGCRTCAYSCCVHVGDYHTDCTKGKCIHCEHGCDQYMPENDLSSYIREHHEYDDDLVGILNDLFDIVDIMKKPELHQKALKILMLVNSEEE